MGGDRFNRLWTEHAETRKVVAQLLGAHNHFVCLGFFARLRWLLFGNPK